MWLKEYWKKDVNRNQKFLKIVLSWNTILFYSDFKEDTVWILKLTYTSIFILTCTFNCLILYLHSDIYNLLPSNWNEQSFHLHFDINNLLTWLFFDFHMYTVRSIIFDTLILISTIFWPDLYLHLDMITLLIWLFLDFDCTVRTWGSQ